MKIFLIGFMGCGKSAIGIVLASRLNYSFVDTDKLIEERLGTEILTLFKTDGEKTFRQAENEMIHDIIKKPGRLVIAAGGGMPCSEENLKLMDFFGTTIYLKRSVDDLLHKLQQNNIKRPLLEDAPNLRIRIHDLLESRKACYEKAKHVLEVSPSETIEEVVDRIACLVCSQV